MEVSTTHTDTVKETHCRRSTYFRKTCRPKVEKVNFFASSYKAQLTDLTKVAPQVQRKAECRNQISASCSLDHQTSLLVHLTGSFLPANYPSWVF